MCETESSELGNGACRLCGGSLTARFGIKVLRKYDVRYYACKECHSLQTEKPYWLDEAYQQNLSDLDTGAAQRNLHNLAACYATARLFGAKNVVDFGGSDGLLCRLLRDYRINCFVVDKYAKPTYSQGFTTPDFEKPDLVLAFEVLEHFANPQQDLNKIFAAGANLVLLSTLLYNNENEDWWYISPESGQHIFFYTRNAIELIGRKYGYIPLISGGFVLFVRQGTLTPARSFFAKLLLKHRMCLLVKSLMAFKSTPGIKDDHSRMRSQS